MALKTRTWSMQNELKKATFSFEIADFGEAKRKLEKGRYISSKQVVVGRSIFSLEIYPGGDEPAEVGKISVFLSNDSKHDVLIDLIVTVCGAESEAIVNKKLVKKKGWGFDFKDVDGGKFEVVVEVTLRKEEVVDEEADHAEENVVKVLKRGLQDLEDNLEEKARKIMRGGAAQLNLHCLELRRNIATLKTEVTADIDVVKANVTEVQTGFTEVGAAIAEVKTSMANTRSPAVDLIPECPICVQQLLTPKKIVQCLQGHKICEPCSNEDAVMCCPTCKMAFMGRDFGMESFVRDLCGRN